MFVFDNVLIDRASLIFYLIERDLLVHKFFCQDKVSGERELNAHGGKAVPAQGQDHNQNLHRSYPVSKIGPEKKFDTYLNSVSV